MQLYNQIAGIKFAVGSQAEVWFICCHQMVSRTAR